MKRLVFRSEVVMSVVLSLFLVLCLGQVKIAQAADVIQFTYQGKWEGHEKQNWAAEQLKLADHVKAATNGGVTIKSMGETVRDNEVIDGVRTGVIDIGNQALHARRELSVVNFISLPFVPLERVPEIMEKLKPIFEKEWEKLGVKQLGYVYFLPQNLYTKQPADTLEAVKGMKLRIMGNALVQLFKDAGSSPITMNNSEVYTSLQRGLIDGAQSALAGYVSGAWYETAKYLSAWPLGSAAMGVVMNMDSWKKMSPQLQGQFMSAVATMEKAQFAGVFKDLSALNEEIKQKGGIRKDPSQAEKDKLLAFAGPIVKDWKEKSGPQADTVLKTINEVLGTKYN